MIFIAKKIHQHWHTKDSFLLFLFRVKKFIKILENGKFLTFDDVRKGMTLLDIEADTRATTVFEVDLTSLENDLKLIKAKYEPVITIRHIRQACKIKIAESEMNLENEKVKSFRKYNDYNSDEFEVEINPTVKKAKRKNNNLNPSKKAEEIIINPKQPIKLILQFKNFPEYINIGDNVIINDNLLRAFGVVNKLIN